MRSRIRMVPETAQLRFWGVNPTGRERLLWDRSLAFSNAKSRFHAENSVEPAELEDKAGRSPSTSLVRSKEAEHERHRP